MTQRLFNVLGGNMTNNVNKMPSSRGFTLVELSIVIIIIGFLIAGIAAGNSLIKQAALNSVVTDLQSYQTAYNNFILRYNAIPGDMKSASTYWTDGVCAETATNCDGDGNGLILFETNAGDDETAPAMKELSLAGMISAGLQVIPDGWQTVDEVVGVTLPASKISGAGYIMAGPSHIFGGDGSNGSDSPWTDGITNAVFIGKPLDAVSANAQGLGGGALKPEEAFNLDKKIDDGTVSGSDFTGATTGNLRSVISGGADTLGQSCASGNLYNLTETNTTCHSGLAMN